ncbi:MAG: ATP-binding protein [Betaproteobacteria bacterium]|nr:ATP-binding protein [Betaproteobacteria bacterium]
MEVAIFDTGVGIPGEQLRHAFTAPRTTKLHGLGVGLPLVHRTLERMGGGIVLSSTQGRGTTVRFTLPNSV